MRDAFIVINDFVHDLATGFWLALVLVMAGLRRSLLGVGLLSAGRPVLTSAFRWASGALAVVLVTGVLRTLTYRDPPGVDPGLRRLLLIVKHVLLGAAFAWGMAYAWSLAFA